MASRARTSIAVMLTICFSLIISIPIIILSTTLSNYGIINESIQFSYNPTNSSIMKNLNINTDLGEIEIGYVEAPIDYCVKLEVNIEMKGLGLSGKSYFDYFKIMWQNADGLVNFSMELKAGIDQVEVLSLIKNISITVILKADLICDINVNVNIEGSIKIRVPYAVTTGEIFTTLSKGNIQYDFSYCNVQGNVTGIVNSGEISFLTNHIQYTKNSKLTFINYFGYTSIEILQNCEIGANITGTALTKTGIVKIKYRDESPNVGARFTLYNKTTFGNEVETKWIGFNRTILPFNAGQMFTSYDYPTQNNYNFTINKFYNWGEFMWDFYSVPI